MAPIYEDEPIFSGPLVIKPMPPPEDHTKRLNCERSNAPIFTIRVLGAILILLRLFAGNFIFGAEANISAQASSNRNKCKRH